MKPFKPARAIMPVIILLTLLALPACESSSPAAQISDGRISVEFDGNLLSRVSATFGGTTVLLGDYSPSEYATVAGNDLKLFPVAEQQEGAVDDPVGKGRQLTVSGISGDLRKTVQVTLYENFPGMAVFNVRYTNTGETDLALERWVNQHYQVKAGQSSPALWSFQSGSYGSRPDWLLPLAAGFSQDNYMGMNASDYGGGTPVVDVWRKEAGLGVGHLEMVPKLVSLPVTMPDGQAAYLGVTHQKSHTLKPGETLETYQTFAYVHQGDCFATLSAYRRMMVARGIELADYPETSYQPVWCAWGFERDFTIDQIYNALPKVKELGFDWAVLDDGWQTAEGDWYLLKSKFPKGDADMRRLTATMHQAGLQAKLWWAPLAVDPGTDLIRDHADYLLLNEDGSKQDISWWDAYYLCPAYPPVQAYTRKLVEKIMRTWDYDGLKIDGQHLNAAPPCYNPAHNHAYPEEAFEKVPEFFKAIYETARSIKPNAVVEICPCGTAYAFHTMPYMNQPVSSDPESSWQIRLKGKTLKALMGPSMPYYGDHVELSDGRDDFASTVGIGGVVGTKFTWPVGAKKDSKIDLTPEKETVWKKWVDIYREKMLSSGIYRGELYDLGFDRPEAHAIEKDGRMYYAFYADTFQGEVELRGLGDRSYRVSDYENGKDLGTVSGPQAKLPVSFSKHLLLEAVPE